MEINTVIEIAPSDLEFLETMFGAEKKEWEIAELYHRPIKTKLDNSPNDIASHINDLVQIGIKTLKLNYESNRKR